MATSRIERFPGEFDPEFDELDTEIRQGDVISFVQTGDLEPEGAWTSNLGVISVVTSGEHGQVGELLKRAVEQGVAVSA